MGHILLLGAGFSRNWGGLLATEVFDQLIGHPDIREDAYLVQVLWDNKTSGGFENALAEVQLASARDPRRYAASLQRLQGAVSSVFENMNQAFFARGTMEFQEHQERLLRTFLVRFDTIFSLNQDVLLEHHYFRHVELAGARRWGGAQLPGMRRIPNDGAIVDSSWGRDTWVPLDPAQFRIEEGLQPCFKLHGSSNWRDAEDGQLLVIGGDKSRTIRSHAVLAWNFGRFRDYLAEPNMRLFVIGYSFRDSHINKAIIEAVRHRDLRFFVIAPSGSDVVRRANPSFGAPIYAPNDLDDAFRQGLIGASPRPLTETFGNDVVSHGNVMGFFN